MTEEYKDLLKEINSNEFNTLQCIHYLRRFLDNIGIHHYLVKKLRTYPYDELEFFIPQFVQLLVAFETDSMALEDFLFDYCAEYPHFSLIVFWSLQAYIFELRNDPDSYSFQTVRRFINKLQNILFNTDAKFKPHLNQVEFRENLQPSIVLCGMIAASIGSPRINNYARDLIKSQGKQQKSFVFKLANFQKTLTKNLTMKNQRISTEGATMSEDEITTTGPAGRLSTTLNNDTLQRSSSLSRISTVRKISTNLIQLSDYDSETHTDDDVEHKKKVTPKQNLSHDTDFESISQKRFSIFEDSLKINTTIKSKKSLKKPYPALERDLSGDISTNFSLKRDITSVSQSMPDLTQTGSETPLEGPYLSPTESESSIFYGRSSSEHGAQQSQIPPNLPSQLDAQKFLQVNYAKKETDFIMSLQNISLRLSQVPKEARLSALRAELSIINRNDVPSEIDIPQLLPVTSNKNKKYHKILKLNVNEACVLNSAERVPFLLLIEYLSDEMDFNPNSEENQKIIYKKSKPNEENSPRVLSKLAEQESSSIRTSIDDFDEARQVAQVEADLSDISLVFKKNSLNDIKSTTLFDDIQDTTANEDLIDISPIPQYSSDVTTKVLADQMRIASVMLQQLESSGQSTSEQSLAIKRRIIESMKSLQDQFDSIDYDKIIQLGGDHNAGERKLENDFKLGEDWNTKKQRIRKSSVYGHLQNWELCSVIVKNGDDLPQEAFACQLITMMSNIWKKNGIGAWTKRMKILITSANAGLVETITNAMSIHSIKKSLTEISITQGENLKGRIFTLKDYFDRLYGSEESYKYRQAQDNFASSLASYSIICYILQIKDRHNGNIMLDNEGHIIHIDFGFLLSNSPGSLGFEAAPFKLTAEYVDVLGGMDSPAFKKFKDLCKRCFNELRKNSEQIINMVELMQKDSSLPCFKNGENTSVLLRQRLQLQLTDSESDLYVESFLIGRSLGSVYTRLYDQFQMVTQGIYS